MAIKTFFWQNNLSLILSELFGHFVLAISSVVAHLPSPLIYMPILRRVLVPYTLAVSKLCFFFFFAVNICDADAPCRANTAKLPASSFALAPLSATRPKLDFFVLLMIFWDAMGQQASGSALSCCSLQLLWWAHCWCSLLILAMLVSCLILPTICRVPPERLGFSLLWKGMWTKLQWPME